MVRDFPGSFAAERSASASRRNRPRNDFGRIAECLGHDFRELFVAENIPFGIPAHHGANRSNKRRG